MVSISKSNSRADRNPLKIESIWLTRAPRA
jgi:hypothetical protein